MAISYLDEHQDAEATKKVVEEAGVKALLLPGDLRSEDQCKYGWLCCNACKTQNANALHVSNVAIDVQAQPIRYKELYVQASKEQGSILKQGEATLSSLDAVASF